MRAVHPFYLKENKTKTSKVREQHHSTFHKKIVKTSFITTIINITNLGLEIDICSSTQQSFNHLFVAILRSLYEGSVSILFERKQNQNIKSQKTTSFHTYYKKIVKTSFIHNNHKYHKPRFGDLHLLQETIIFQPPLCHPPKKPHKGLRCCLHHSISKKNKTKT